MIRTCPACRDLLDLPRYAERPRNPTREASMIPIDLSGKVALVTGVGNDLSFAWYIAKALQASGARIVLACHPRMMNMVNTILTSSRPDDAVARKLPF